MVAGSVQEFARDAHARDALLEGLRRLKVSKVYVEVYRGGDTVDPAELISVRDSLLSQGFQVAAGIATVPGGDFGVPADTGLHWFNWQNEKTQRDLRAVVERTAREFDEFVVDDFLCTMDQSVESDAARRGRTWSEYRRDLLTGLSQSVFIAPAKAVRPGITMIVKYPQWYDRFHLFGYDVEREPQLYDRVWVGTETRGSRTQRFGFVQPYEGFVNFRWLSGIAGAKIGGAWFDHLDCGAQDFIEQAYQTVLAGAREIILFNSHDLAAGHPGHDLLCAQFAALDALAAAVKEHPVSGVVAYKPFHSDALGDLYLMDYAGMLGVPLVPTHVLPEEAPVIFLPAQAASDPDIAAKVSAAAQAGKTVVMTTAFLAAAKEGATLCRLAGLEAPVISHPLRASEIVIEDRPHSILHGLDLEAELVPAEVEIMLEAVVENRRVPCLTRRGNVVVWNTHTFTQADFDAVGEMLLAPRRLGLLEIPQAWANTLRAVFTRPLGLDLDAPARVTLQPLGDAGWFFYNYNESPVEIAFRTGDVRVLDGFTGETLDTSSGQLRTTLPPRSPLWVKCAEGG
jgi:hypothetical protein